MPSSTHGKRLGILDAPLLGGDRALEQVQLARSRMVAGRVGAPTGLGKGGDRLWAGAEIVECRGALDEEAAGPRLVAGGLEPASGLGQVPIRVGDTSEANLQERASAQQVGRGVRLAPADRVVEREGRTLEVAVGGVDLRLLGGDRDRRWPAGTSEAPRAPDPDVGAVKVPGEAVALGGERQAAGLVLSAVVAAMDAGSLLVESGGIGQAALRCERGPLPDEVVCRARRAGRGWRRSHAYWPRTETRYPRATYRARVSSIARIRAARCSVAHPASSPASDVARAFRWAICVETWPSCWAARAEAAVRWAPAVAAVVEIRSACWGCCSNVCCAPWAWPRASTICCCSCCHPAMAEGPCAAVCAIWVPTWPRARSKPDASRSIWWNFPPTSPGSISA